MYKLEIFVPKEFSLHIINEISKIGAARLGNYDNVASITKVTGYWRALKGANPYNGDIDKLTSAKEDKIETICPKEILFEVLKRVRDIHPYEEPLINVIELIG